MKEQLMLVRLDTAYCNYLRKFDDKFHITTMKKN